MKTNLSNNILFLTCIFLLVGLNFTINTININQRFNESLTNSTELSKLLYRKGQDPKTVSKQFTSLTINPPSGKSGVINLSIKNLNLITSFGLIDKKFALNSNNYKFLNATSDIVELKGNSILTNSLNSLGNIQHNGVNQWRMVEYNSWSKNKTTNGWNHTKTSSCGPYTMIGGKCQLSNKEIVKTITNLPEHTMVRVEALFHFMGSWDSETGYLKKWDENDYKKLENTNKYLWTLRCKKDKSTPIVKISICEEDVCQVASPISVTIPHKEKTLKLSFGSTITSNACEKSYGVSDVKIYIR